MKWNYKEIKVQFVSRAIEVSAMEHEINAGIGDTAAQRLSGSRMRTDTESGAINFL
jgi:hypothetical protein